VAALIGLISFLGEANSMRPKRLVVKVVQSLLSTVGMRLVPADSVAGAPRGFFVPEGQSIYDPEVFGVYTRNSESVVPKSRRPYDAASNLDLLMKDAQTHVRLAQRKPEANRLRVAVKFLEPGSGLCIDACTGQPDELVKRTIEGLGYTYKAIDIHPGHPDVQEEDLQNLSFAADNVAQIFSCDTLEHIPDYVKGLSEMYRVLKPEGLAIVHLPVYFFDKPEGEPMRPGIDPWEHTRYFSAREVIGAASQIGFAVLRVTLCLDYGALVLVLAKGPVATNSTNT